MYNIVQYIVYSTSALFLLPHAYDIQYTAYFIYTLIRYQISNITIVTRDMYNLLLQFNFLLFIVIGYAVIHRYVLINSVVESLLNEFKHTSPVPIIVYQILGAGEERINYSQSILAAVVYPWRE